ncbi:MAG: S8 family serine peptidase [bacterium]|nr:S8 family serine peptidase [bacterium]
MAPVKSAVEAVGGEITHKLGIINAVSAELTPSEVEALRVLNGDLRLYEDHSVRASGKPNKPTKPTTSEVDDTVAFSVVVGADRLHDEGIFGYGPAVAVLDTGIHGFMGLIRGFDDRWRQQGPAYDFTQENLNNVDESGHGTHLTSIIANNTRTGNKRNPGEYRGIAPDCDLVPTKAFGPQGQSSYSTIIWALDWLVTNKETYNIRVLNLSFSAEPRSYYWDDPLNQAVMAAWEAGIVVVASAGNVGPDPMTIGVPGNIPYIITVGAMSDNYTPANDSDDYLASFSSAGPTVYRGPDDLGRSDPDS